MLSSLYVALLSPRCCTYIGLAEAALLESMPAILYCTFYSARALVRVELLHFQKLSISNAAAAAAAKDGTVCAGNALHA